MIIEIIFVLWKWRYFVISMTFIPFFIAILIAYSIQTECKSKTVIVSISSNINELNQFTSLKKNAIARALGSKLFGIGKTNDDVILGLLKSNNLKKEIIHRFTLTEYYETANIEETIRKFGNDFSFTPNEYGMIEISVLNRDPEVAAEILKFTIEKLDSLFEDYQLQLFKNSRSFLEKRFNETKIKLSSTENSLVNFQMKHGVYDVPVQMEFMLGILLQLQSQFLNLEVENEILKNNVGLDSYKYQLSNARMKNFKEVLQNYSEKIESNVLNPHIFSPDVYLKYFSLKRKIKVNEVIYKSLLSLFEAFKIRENSNVPTIMVLDEAVPPSNNELPRRSFIVISGFFIPLFFNLVLVFRGNNVLSEMERRNHLDFTEFIFFKRIQKIFKVI
jgi:capsule polysaccharide export protein KpsE/RkpR